MEHIWFHSDSIRQVQLPLIKEVWQSSSGTVLSKLVGLCTTGQHIKEMKLWQVSASIHSLYMREAQSSRWKQSLSFYFKRIMISVIIISYEDICILGCTPANLQPTVFYLNSSWHLSECPFWGDTDKQHTQFLYDNRIFLPIQSMILPIWDRWTSGTGGLVVRKNTEPSSLHSTANQWPLFISI